MRVAQGALANSVAPLYAHPSRSAFCHGCAISMHFPRGRVYQACLSNTAHCTATCSIAGWSAQHSMVSWASTWPEWNGSPRHASAQAKATGISVRASSAPENMCTIRVPPCSDTSSTAPAPCKHSVLAHPDRADTAAMLRMRPRLYVPSTVAATLEPQVSGAAELTRPGRRAFLLRRAVLSSCGRAARDSMNPHPASMSLKAYVQSVGA